MVQSNSLDTSTIENLVKRAVDYLRQWTGHELETIITQSLKDSRPIIAEIGKQVYLVGHYCIRQVDNKWWQVIYRYSDNDGHYFANRTAAVCYAVCQQTGKLVLADRILKLDQDVGRFLIKTDFFKARFYQAQQKNNLAKVDLFKNRYFEAKIRLTEAQHQLEKSLKSAKYF